MKQYRWLMALVVGTFLVASCGGMQAEVPADGTVSVLSGHEPGVLSQPTSAGGVMPYIIAGANPGGNRTCTEVAMAFGVEPFDYSSGKIDFPSPSFSEALAVYGIDVEYDAATKLLAWTSDDFSISAVIVKGSADANVYYYNPAADGDEGLGAPNNAGLSNITFCWNDGTPVGPDEAISVDKTAFTRYTRTHNWEIDKSVDPADLYLYTDGSGDDTVTWFVDVTYGGFTDGYIEVYGEITIENIGTDDLTVVTVEDAINGFEGVVSCVDDDDNDLLPATLKRLETLVCSYVVELDEVEDGTNTATVNGAFASGTPISNETAPKDFTFGDPTKEVHRYVEVTDTNDGFKLKYGDPAPDAPVILDAHKYDPDDVEKFEYSQDFAWANYGRDECLDRTIENTARIIGDDEVELDFATATLNVYIQCFVFEGESVTGAGLPWSDVQRAPNTWFEYTNETSGEADLIQGRQHNVVGEVEIDEGELCFTLFDEWELDESKDGNVKIQPLDAKPSRYLQPGAFDLHFTETGSEFCVPVPAADYGYAIHLDAGFWMPDPAFGPE